MKLVIQLVRVIGDRRNHYLLHRAGRHASPVLLCGRKIESWLHALSLMRRNCHVILCGSEPRVRAHCLI